MAAALVEKLLMNYFFDSKDKRRQTLLKNLFMLDMQFNLKTGKVAQSTSKLPSEQLTQRILKIYDESIDEKYWCDTVSEQKEVLGLIDEVRFMQNMKQFEEQDLLDFAKEFKLRHIPAGSRVYSSYDKFESFNLIISGNMGIFYIDQ